MTSHPAEGSRLLPIPAFDSKWFDPVDTSYVPNVLPVRSNNKIVFGKPSSQNHQVCLAPCPATHGHMHPSPPQAFYSELSPAGAAHATAIFIGDHVRVRVPAKDQTPASTMELVFVTCWVCVTPPPCDPPARTGVVAACALLWRLRPRRCVPHVAPYAALLCLCMSHLVLPAQPCLRAPACGGRDCTVTRVAPQVKPARLATVPECVFLEKQSERQAENSPDPVFRHPLNHIEGKVPHDVCGVEVLRCDRALSEILKNAKQADKADQQAQKALARSLAIPGTQEPVDDQKAAKREVCSLPCLRVTHPCHMSHFCHTSHTG